jgi:hypothetical protein
MFHVAARGIEEEEEEEEPKLGHNLFLLHPFQFSFH